MKKTYSAPSIQIVKIQLQNLIASSEFNSNKGIVYGGVDKDGSMEPGIKSKNIWYEEW